MGGIIPLWLSFLTGTLVSSGDIMESHGKSPRRCVVIYVFVIYAFSLNLPEFSFPLAKNLRWCILNEEQGKEGNKYYSEFQTIPYCQWFQFSSVQSLSRVRLLWPHELQHTRPPCPSPTSGVHSDLRPTSPWCHPLLSLSAPALSLSQHHSLFQWVNSLHEVAKVLEFQL